MDDLEAAKSRTELETLSESPDSLDTPPMQNMTTKDGSERPWGKNKVRMLLSLGLLVAGSPAFIVICDTIMRHTVK
jgi:hypothetical protein